MIQEGQIAPDFTLPRDGGEEISLSSFKGQNVVLYFYPKDNTPGCTTEALDFTALGAEFKAANTVVLGISKDTVAKHEKFRDKYSLGVILLSDSDGNACENYGVWGEKSMYGKIFQGITRATFLIDADGKVAKVWPKVKVTGHAEEVLDAVKAL
ncbi:MAG: thioredoxin-dependent thiol peroxidase [Paracoccaceae bacterium]|nr:thioredoxin-dependent thiol peroxidase [Paracoccaceae bacterium]